MWQLFTFVSLAFQAGEEVLDKVIIVSNLAVHSMVATFYRNLVFFIIALMVGLLGLVGPMHLILTWPIVLVGLFGIGSAYFYTYLLKHIELTGSSALSYSRPAIFLLIDIIVLHTAFTGNQIVGVLLLIFGGVLFVLNPITHHLKPEYTKYVWLIFLFETVAYAAEYYVFKHYVTTINLNEISYLLSYYVIVVVGLFVLAAWLGSWQDFVATATHNHYLAKVAVSKSFDVTYSLFWYHALKLASVSQVNALEAFYPLMLLVLVYMAETEFKFDAREKLDRVNLTQKIIATVVLVVGAWLAT